MASARRTAPGEPLNTADVVRSISAQPDNYAAACATLALAADVDARTVQATAAFGVLPAALAKTGKTGTPLRATLVVTIVLAIMSSFPGAINFLIGMGTLCSAIVVVTICLSIIAARKKNPGKSTFHAPGGTALPVLMMLVIVVCYIPDILAGGWQLWACTLGYFAVGMVIYWLGTRRSASGEENAS